MTHLGSIYGTDDDTDAVRGPDLDYTVTVRRAALRKLGGVVAVSVPERLDVGSEGTCRRQPDPGDGGFGPITLRVPDDLPSGAVLRLRRQGGDASTREGRPGDLRIRVLVDEREHRPMVWLVAATLLLIGSGAALLWLFQR